MTRTLLLAVCVTVTALAVTAAGIQGAVGAAIILAAAAAATDAWERRIPNLLSGAVALVGLQAWLVAEDPLAPLLLALAVFAGLYVLFELDFMGGGDVKLIPGLALVAASVGTAEQAPIRLALLLGTMFAVAAVWAALARERDAPVAVGAALALAIAVA